MTFKVYFQYGETTEEKDFLDEFDTLKQAQEYRSEQIEKEGWDDDDATHQSYALQYVIVEE
jgi:hypothetical protein